MSIADVEAEDVPRGLIFALAVLDVEDVVRRQVVHRERRVGGDHARAANCASWRTGGGEAGIRKYKKLPYSGLFLKCSVIVFFPCC